MAAAAPATQTTNPSGNAFQMDYLGVKMISVYNTQITDGDYWWNLIQAIDASYKPDRTYTMNRTLFFKFTDGSYGICALDVLLNMANLVACSAGLHLKMSAVEMVVQKYLTETIKQLEVTPEIANAVGFKLQIYTSTQCVKNASEFNRIGMVPASTQTSLGRKDVVDTLVKGDIAFQFNSDWTVKNAQQEAARPYFLGPCFSKPKQNAETQTQVQQDVAPQIMPSSHIISISHKFGF